MIYWVVATQISFIFTPIWGRFPFWLLFFKRVETTNQFRLGIFEKMLHCFGLVIFHDVAVAHRSSRHRVPWARKVAVAISRGISPPVRFLTVFNVVPGSSVRDPFGCFKWPFQGLKTWPPFGLSKGHFGRSWWRYVFFQKKKNRPSKGFLLEMDGFKSEKSEKKQRKEKPADPFRTFDPRLLGTAGRQTPGPLPVEKFPRFSASHRICWEKFFAYVRFLLSPKKRLGKEHKRSLDSNYGQISWFHGDGDGSCLKQRLWCFVQFRIRGFCAIAKLNFSGFHPVVKLKLIRSVIPIASYGFRIGGDFKIQENR